MDDHEHIKLANDTIEVYCPLLKKQIEDADCYEIVNCGLGYIKKDYILRLRIGTKSFLYVQNAVGISIPNKIQTTAKMTFRCCFRRTFSSIWLFENVSNMEQINKDIALKAFEKLREKSKEKFSEELSLEEINNEINEARFIREGLKDLEENKTYDGSSIIKNIKEKYGL